jgi:hypothetical protein
MQDIGIEYVMSLFKSDFLQNAAHEALDRTTWIALLLASFLFSLTLGWNYLANGFKSLTEGKPGKIIDINELARVMVIILCIFCYKPLATTVVDISHYFNSLSAPSSNDYAEMVAAKDKQTVNNEINQIEEAISSNDISEPELTAMKNRIEALRAGPRTEESSFTLLEIVNVLKNLPYYVLHAAAYTLFGMIKITVLLIAQVIIQFAIIVGPLALAFSILPIFKNQIETWFSFLINTLFISTTYNVLDFLHNKLFIKLYDVENTMHTDLFIILQLVYLVLYLMPFFLTSKFAGKNDGGRIVSKGLQLATIAAVAAFSGGAGAAASGGGAGGGGTADKVLNSAKDAFSSNDES